MVGRIVVTRLGRKASFAEPKATPGRSPSPAAQKAFPTIKAILADRVIRLH